MVLNEAKFIRDANGDYDRFAIRLRLVDFIKNTPKRSAHNLNFKSISDRRLL
jgi:hypothetical protein